MALPDWLRCWGQAGAGLGQGWGRWVSQRARGRWMWLGSQWADAEVLTVFSLLSFLPKV